MNIARLALTVFRRLNEPVEIKKILASNWHPGPPPERPKKPGKGDGLIAWAVWRYESNKWRNHDKKDSPFWDWYRVFGKSEYWLAVRAAKLDAAGYRCEKREHGTRCAEVSNLQCHHKTYRYLGNEMDHLSCLIVLCDHHHRMAHGAGAEGLLSRKGRQLLTKLIG